MVTATKTRQESRKVIAALARFGYAARGVVYCIVGALAVLAALGSGQQAAGSGGALRALFAEPFGPGALVVLAVGLLGFALWRAVQAVLDPDRNGTSSEGLLTRAAYFVGALTYGLLAGSALSLVFGSGNGGDDDASARDWTAWLLSQPFGRWITDAVGIAVAGAGVSFIVEAWRADVTQHMRFGPEVRRWIVPLGRAGYAASGAVSVLIGTFLLFAAVQGNSAEARGLSGSLGTVQQAPYGWILLSFFALGLFAFGVFGIMQAIYRDVDPPDLNELQRLTDR
jgi:hypothetical protein